MSNLYNGILYTLCLVSATLCVSECIRVKRMKMELQKWMDSENDLESIKNDTEEVEMAKQTIREYFIEELNKFISRQYSDIIIIITRTKTTGNTEMIETEKSEHIRKEQLKRIGIEGEDDGN